MAGNSASPLDGEFHQATPLIPPGPPALSPLLTEKSLRPRLVSPPATRFPLVLNAIFTFLDFLGEGFRGLRKLCQPWGGRSRHLAWSTPPGDGRIGGRAESGGFF